MLLGFIPSGMIGSKANTLGIRAFGKSSKKEMPHGCGNQSSGSEIMLSLQSCTSLAMEKTLLSGLTPFWLDPWIRPHFIIIILKTKVSRRPRFIFKEKYGARAIYNMGFGASVKVNSSSVMAIGTCLLQPPLKRLISGL